MKMHFNPIGIENCHLITKETDSCFLFLIQRAVLLGLKEAGLITLMQHRQAEEMLLLQYREDIRMHAMPVSDD